MGISDDGIASVGTDIKVVIKELIDSMGDDESELLSLYYGCDVSEEDSEELLNLLCEEFPDYEIEMHRGNQPIYYYIISVE